MRPGATSPWGRTRRCWRVTGGFAVQGIFAGLETGLSGLQAAQAALDVVGQNVANVSTPGYHRQRAVLTAAPALPQVSEGAQAGTGVNVTGIQRAVDHFLTSQSLTQSSNVGYWQTTTNGLSQVQAAFQEPSSSGLQTAMDQFWQAWQDLSNQPQDAGVRQEVLSRAQSLIATFQSVSSQLSATQGNLDSQVVAQVASVNDLAGQIASLNAQIENAQVVGETPNDLIDQRGVLLSKLAAITSIRVQPLESGGDLVFVGGVPLVNGRTTHALETVPSTQNPALHTVQFRSISGSVDITGGSLGADLTLRDQTIATLSTQLNTLAYQLAQAVNNQHAQGYGTDGTTTGLPFFVPPSSPQNAASQLAVNPTLIQNPQDIAAAAHPNSPGGGNNALAIGQLNSTAISALGGTMDSYYRGMIGSLGVDAQTAQNMNQQAQLMSTTVQNQIQSVSGVSLNTQGVRLVMFQHAYDASATVIQTINSMLSTLVNRL